MEIDISNLEVITSEKKVLKDFNLHIGKGEIHTLMGPNGAGKSSLTRAIMGDPNYEVVEGKILCNDKNILSLNTTQRSKLGIFLAMQHPTEIEGVSNQDFLRTAMSSLNNKNVGLYDFIKSCEQATDDLKMNKALIGRAVNVGFSGGEKKKNEVLQIKLLKPSFIILDEIDSGLDIDSLNIVAQNILSYKKEYPDTSILIITHHPKILDIIRPDYVHILDKGRLKVTGNYDLALEIENTGYNHLIKEEENE